MLAQFELILSRIGAVLLALITTFSSLLGMTGGGIPEEAATEDTLCLTVAAISDTHIKDGVFGASMLTPALRDMSSEDLDTDVVLFLGDNTDNGNEANWTVFTESVMNYCTVPNKIVAIGNHDTWSDYESDHEYEEALEEYLHYSNMIMGTDHTTPYFTTQVCGYWFITLGTEGTGVGATVTDTQLNWLETQLDAAAAASRGRPVFVLMHQPMNYTHTVGDNIDGNGFEDNGQSEKLKDLLDRYENIFYLSGHMHYGLNDGTDNLPVGYSTIERVGKNITSVNLPCYSYGSYVFGGDPLIGDGMVINIYADRVEFLGRNFFMGGWLDYAQTVYLTGAVNE